MKRVALDTAVASFVADGTPRSTEPPPGRPQSRQTVPMVPLSVRIPDDLARRLRAAHAARLVDRSEPYAVQDIVAAALEKWLPENGHA